MNNSERAEIHSGIAWAIIFSLAAIIMAVIALATVCPRNDLSLDYMGVIVGILSLLVTALIGWQVFNLIKIDRLKDNLETAEKRITEVKKDAQKELYEHSALMMSIHSKDHIGKFDLHAVNKDYASLSFAYSMAVSALRYSLEANTDSITDSCLDTLSVCIRIAHTFKSWDDVFPPKTAAYAEATYYVILPLAVSLLSHKQTDRLMHIHNCRKNRVTHPSLKGK